MPRSANFTDAGIRQRIEVGVRLENDPQVQELTEWFDAQWLRAYELDKVLLKRIAAFMKLLPKEQVVEDTPNSVISPPLSTQLTLSLFRGRRLFPVKGCFSFLPPVEFTQLGSDTLRIDFAFRSGRQ